jgi:hypothetical protein
MKYNVNNSYFIENNYTILDPFHGTDIIIYYKKIGNYVIFCDTSTYKIKINKGIFQFNDLDLEIEILNLTK